MTFVRYSSTLKFLSVASSDLISLVTNSISPSVKPASTSFFFCSSVNLNSVDLSVSVVFILLSCVSPVGDFEVLAFSYATSEPDFLSEPDFSAVVSSSFSGLTTSLLGCSAFFLTSTFLSSVDLTVASTACGASALSATTTLGVMNII